MYQLMKTTLKVSDLTPSTVTNADAVGLKIAMKDAVLRGEAIVLSFHGVTTLTTSFLNSSIGEIIDEFGFDMLKGKLSLIDYTPPIGKMISTYIADLRNIKA
ncbi:MAG: DUF4325 domain-containing protein [Bacteroidetes bacterium]|nr:MAG: DUF4325 domain-containing protein [Bacteroidota bacterium]